MCLLLGHMIILSGARFAVSESTVDLSKPQRWTQGSHSSLTDWEVRQEIKPVIIKPLNDREILELRLGISMMERWKPENSAHNLESCLSPLLLGVHFCASNTLEFAR